MGLPGYLLCGLRFSSQIWALYIGWYVTITRLVIVDPVKKVCLPGWLEMPL